MPLRTMLAEAIKPEHLDQSLFDKGEMVIQPKYDGIRVQTDHCVAFSGRDGKMLPNDYVQSFVQTQLARTNLDGEMMVLDDKGNWLPFADLILPDGSRVRGAESWLMTKLGAPKFKYMVFDDLTSPRAPYNARYALAKMQVDFLHQQGFRNQIEMVPYYPCITIEHYMYLEDSFVNSGYEGACARLTGGHYKEGRSTFNERLLLKHKRFVDAEAYILSYEPLVRIDGTVDDFLMGALVCRSNSFDEEFKIGTGFSTELRRWFAANWSEFMVSPPRRCTFKFQPHGSRDRPRSPVFRHLRNSD